MCYCDRVGYHSIAPLVSQCGSTNLSIKATQWTSTKWPLYTGLLYKNIHFWAVLKWPLYTGFCYIDVAAKAGSTLYHLQRPETYWN